VRSNASKLRHAVALKDVETLSYRLLQLLPQRCTSRTSLRCRGEVVPVHERVLGEELDQRRGKMESLDLVLLRCSQQCVRLELG
jgi:hypothetical protein